MIRLLTVIVLAGSSLLSNAQSESSVSLDDMIETAIMQNPIVHNDSLRKNLTLEIKRSWFNWLHAINSTELLDEYRSTISDIDRIADLRFKAGDIDYIQYGNSIEILGEIDADISVFENKKQYYENKLRQLSYVKSDIQPIDSSIELYEINKTQQFFSYEQDSLNEYLRFAKELEIENKQIELDNLFIRLQYYRSYQLDFASGIQEIAIARLKSEDIDYLEYSALIKLSFKSRLQFLDILNQYNQSAIELEYYAY